MDDLGSYMLQRDGIFIELQRMRPTPAEAAALRSRVERILEMDAIIIGRMALLRSEAEAEMNKLSNGRVAKNTYDDYTPEQESHFFDTKR